MSTAETASTRMLSQSPSRMSGSESLATSQSRKVAFTRGQPGESTIAVPTTARKTTVLTAASAVDRRARSAPVVLAPALQVARRPSSGRTGEYSAGTVTIGVLRSGPARRPGVSH